MSPSEINTRARHRRRAANDPSGLPIPALRQSKHDPVRAMSITDKRVAELTSAERRHLYRVTHQLDKIEAEVAKNGPKSDPATPIRGQPHDYHDPEEAEFIAKLEAEGIGQGEVVKRVALRRKQHRDSAFLAAVTKVFLRTRCRQDRVNILRPLFANGLSPWQAAARTNIEPGFCSRAWHIFQTERAAQQQNIEQRFAAQQDLPPIDMLSIKIPSPNDIGKPDPDVETESKPKCQAPTKSS